MAAAWRSVDIGDIVDKRAQYSKGKKRAFKAQSAQGRIYALDAVRGALDNR